MGFTDAVKSGFQRYFDFATRSSRSEYWFWALFVFIAGIVLGIVDAIIFGDSSVLGGLFALGTLIPGIAVGVRRLHDLGRSGWFFLLVLIPIVGWIILIIWFVTAGNDDENQWGANPLS